MRVKPETVWRRPDEDFRFPVLNAMVGDQWLDSGAPQFVQELTLSATENSDRFSVMLKVFDATWTTIPALLRLGLQENREVNFIVRYGWPHEFRDLDCMALTVKNTILTNGIEYVINGVVAGKNSETLEAEKGKVDTSADAKEGAKNKGKKGKAPAASVPDAPPWKKSYSGRISDIVISILKDNLGYTDADFQAPSGSPPDALPRALVEPTSDPDAKEGFSIEPKKETTSIRNFLWELADAATPLTPFVPPGVTADDAKGLPGQRYTSQWDLDNKYRFVPSIMNAALSAQDAVPLSYPYPATGNPVIEFKLADVTYNSVSFVASGIDPLDPEAGEDTSTVGSDEDGVPMYIPLPPGDRAQRIAHVQATQRSMSQFNMDADITMLGNPLIQFGTSYNFTMQVPGLPKKLWPTFANGLYFTKQLVHAITASGYVTRVVVQRFPGGKAHGDV